MSAAVRRITGPVARLSSSPRGDRLLAGGLFTAFELPVLFHDISAGYPSPGARWVWAVIGAVMTLTVAARRRHPRRTWLVVTVCASFLLATHLPLGPVLTIADPSTLLVLPAPLVCLYTTARAGQVRGGYALIGSGFALVLIPLLNLYWHLHWLLGGIPAWDTPRAYSPQAAVLVAGMLATAWALGETVHARSKSAANEAARIAAEKAGRAEHDRAVAAEERARIAAELHDITAHHISVVALQAGAARMLAESGQPPSVELLSGIETASRQAMIEIRQALGVIRSSADGAAPLPGLTQLPGLTRQMALAGLTVRLDGPAGTLPGSVDLTAYRIVQEGLTNVTRHSAAGTATVTFRRRPGTVQITITDDGPARHSPPAVPGGNGLIGLRERVRRYGGQLHAGTRPGGGFELRAELPLSGTEGSTTAPEPREAEPSP